MFDVQGRHWLECIQLQTARLPLQQHVKKRTKNALKTVTKLQISLILCHVHICTFTHMVASFDDIEFKKLIG